MSIGRPRKAGFDSSSLNQPDQHPDDSLKSVFSGADLVGSQFRFGDQNVQFGGAIERGAVGVTDANTTQISTYGDLKQFAASGRYRPGSA